MSKANNNLAMDPILMDLQKATTAKKAVKHKPDLKDSLPSKKPHISHDHDQKLAVKVECVENKKHQHSGSINRSHQLIEENTSSPQHFKDFQKKECRVNEADIKKEVSAECFTGNFLKILL